MLDALNIRIAPDAVYLYGDDEDGTVNAVVEFLEKYLSVRFFAPDETLWSENGTGGSSCRKLSERSRF